LIVGFAGREGNMEDVKMNRLLLKQAQIIGYVSVTSRTCAYSRNGRLLTRNTAIW
jgi:hypothetical protein